MPWHGPLFTPAGRSLNFWDVYIHVFHKTWQVSSYDFFKTSLPHSLPWSAHSICAGPLCGPIRVRGCCLLSSIIFSFCSSHLISALAPMSHSPVLSLACLHLPWTHLVYFFISGILSAPEFLFGFFLGFLSLYWYFHFVHTFSLLSPHLNFS